MNLLFDTNIILHLSKSSRFAKVKKLVNPGNKKAYTSISTIGEIRSIALQNNWDEQKYLSLYQALEEVTVIEISENIANVYAEINTYSQRRDPAYSTDSFATPRNMGKNDLWIAAPAELLGLKLVITDADFSHLHNTFTEVHQVTPAELKF